MRGSSSQEKSHPRDIGARHHKPDPLTKPPLSKRSDLEDRLVADVCLLMVQGPVTQPLFPPCVYIFEFHGKLGTCALKLKELFFYNQYKPFRQKENDFGTLLTEHMHKGGGVLCHYAEQHLTALAPPAPILSCRTETVVPGIHSWAQGRGHCLAEKCWGSREGMTYRHQVMTS